VVELVDRLWPAMTEVALSDPPAELLLAVSSDCWLTWELAEAGPSSTRVRVVHDEADTSAGPAPELDAVLALLAEAVRAGTPG
jgi:hypothetical protein